MSKPRAYREETLQIHERFFETMSLLAENNRLPGGISGYCETYGIDKRHYFAQFKDRGRGYFDIYWVLPLIKYFSVSPRWLLFGEGKQFRGNYGDGLVRPAVVAE